VNRLRTRRRCHVQCTRSLAIDIGQGRTGRDVVATLERLRFERGLPQRIYCDNGTEFVSAAMDVWAYTNGAQQKVDVSV
jgi:putative transposase